MTYAFSGDGPGVRTPDGCSVSLYRDLPYLGELDEVLHLFAPGMSVLELGCGTGRLCAKLIESACEVTGVDESLDMLRWFPAGVQGVHGRIEDLHLESRFDVVLLASHLINHPDAQVRGHFVDCAWRHLKPRGRVLLKRHDIDWLASVAVGSVGRSDRMSMYIEAVARQSGLVRLTLRYEVGDGTWRHAFATAPLTEAAVEALLSSRGFADTRWVGPRQLWALAERPMIRSGDLPNLPDAVSVRPR